MCVLYEWKFNLQMEKEFAIFFILNRRTVFTVTVVVTVVHLPRTLPGQMEGYTKVIKVK